MAAPVLTETTYGYRIVGGTDATILKTDTLLHVSNLIFFADAGGGWVAITDGDGNAIMTIVADATTAGIPTHLHGLDTYFKGIGCDFSGSASVLLVILK